MQQILVPNPAVRAELSGMKMADRIETIDDFEIKVLGVRYEQLSCFF